MISGVVKILSHVVVPLVVLISFATIQCTPLCAAEQPDVAVSDSTDDAVVVVKPSEGSGPPPMASAVDEDSVTPEGSAQMNAGENQSHEVDESCFSQTVTIYPGSSENHVDAETVRERDKPETVADMLASQPEVHAIGTGGALTTVSVGGLGRNRIQMLINGFRVSADRRAGTDLGTVIPGMIDSIRLHRGGTSLSFGSEAMGAVLDFNLINPDFRGRKTTFSMNYRDNNDYFQSGIRSQWSRGAVMIAYDEAGSYRTPGGEEVDGSFTRYNAIVSTLFPGKIWTTGLDILFTRAEDIGKPSTSSRITVYPEDELSIAGLHFHSAYMSGHVGVIHQYLKTESDGETSTIESGNLHFKAISTFLQPVTLGVEFYTRQNVNASNSFEDVSTNPLHDASSYDVAPFVALKGSLGDKFTAEAGIRYELAKSSNGNLTRDGSNLGGTCSLTWSSLASVIDFSLFSSYRFPSLEEYYYTGLTARGFIEGNPDLDSERGRGARLSARRTESFWSIGLSWQMQYVDDFITRIELEDDYYTYRNIDRARIQDLTLDYTLQSLSLAVSWAEGINRDTRHAIDDIPPMKLMVGWQDRFGSWLPSCSIRHVFRQKNVGPSEQTVDAYTLFSVATTFDVSDCLSLSLQLTNLLNEEYIASADEKAATAPGRSVNLGLLLTL